MSAIVSETMREVTPSLDDGRYVVVSMLRETPRARLYLAEKAGKRFVLKAPQPDSAQSLEMLKREYELSIGLSHPSLAYVFTWETESPVGPCLVQEYVDGRSLDEWLSEKPVKKERRRVFEHLLTAVAYLHGKGVVHNDLTPANILISRADGSLKLIDLGFADDNTHLARSLGGTRRYASPELIAGSRTDARSDIWSLGCLMQDLFPHRYGRIIRRCLRPNPAQRWPSVTALRRAMGARRRIAWIAAGLLATGLILWPFFRPARVVEVQSETLLATVDSLQNALSEREAADASNESALKEAKARVDAVLSRAASTFRKRISNASTPEAITEAWMAFTEDIKAVNFDIPTAAPEAIRPLLRDYIIERNNYLLPRLSEEMTARINALHGLE